ncbi:MAG: MMPL family transporter [Bacteroidetes bacterium]|nr:MMPL family transporter [Bacteroidota bacterium]
MYSFFVSINKYLNKRKWLFFSLFTVVMAGAAYLASGVKIEENLNAIIPEDERISRISEVFDKSQLADQIIFIISHEDSSTVDTDALISRGEQLVEKLEQRKDLVGNIRFKVGGDRMLEIYGFIRDNLPLFLDDEDYREIGKLLTDEEIDRTIEKGFRTLISPTGMATGKFILKDPLNLTPIALKKLNRFQLDDNFILYNSAIFTGDKKNLMIFMDPVYPGSNTQENLKMVQYMDQSISGISSGEDITIEYYGGSAVAVANSVRVKKDIVLTISIALVFFLLIFFIFFRKIGMIVLMFMPVVIGSLVSIAVLTLIYGQVSAIALGVGVIFMGITVDYSLHLFTHIRSGGTLRETIGLITMPVLMSSITTASAFLCLSVVKSEALNQIGVFAAFAVLVSALTVLVLTPLLVKREWQGSGQRKTAVSRRIEKMVGYPFEKNRILVIAVFLLTILFAFTSQKIRFNGDISTLNYMSDRLAKSEAKLKSISSVANSSLYLVTQGSSLEEALTKIESQHSLLESCRNDGLVTEISWVSDLMLSREAQKEKIERWGRFWKEAGREAVKASITSSGKKNHFKEDAFQPFYDLLDKEFDPIAMEEYELLRELFLNNFISTDERTWSVVSILMVDPSDKPELFERFSDMEEFVIFDGQYFINKFFEILKEDFNKLVTISMIVVFLILLVFFGRIEIALITFIPIMISWMWTLGLMGLFGIEINIFNIIISTFVFGLGIDYCIFIMNGIIANHREGNHSLAPYKLSILLSALTTIGAIGVLIFARHPALQSIALVSIFGISTVVLISYTLLPLLFNFLVRSKGKTRLEPLTLSGIVATLIYFMLFLGSAFVATIFLPVIMLLPMRLKPKKRLVSFLIFLSTRFIVTIGFIIRKNYINRELADFSRPSVIISNHQSQLDLVFLLQLNPKMIVLVNKWVWNNAFYGFIIRFADFYPVYKGLDHNFEGLKQKVAEGYSILAFPEASRSPDGSIKRFHQGAFGIADMLGLEVQPLIIHGAYDALPKTEHFLKRGSITMKFFPRIRPEFKEYDGARTYQPQAKVLTAFYREEYRNLQEQLETTDYYRNKLTGLFLYKGPVLEWYMKVKLKIEKNYSLFNELIPRDAEVLDLGCGYGFLSIMLGKTSGKRKITGIDYDERKIAAAGMAALEVDHVSFRVGDITSCEIPPAQVIILNDVLHYLTEELQISLLERCMDTLPPGGMLILRDADAELKRRTLYTRFTEFQSTRLFRFNKTSYPLTYLPATTIEKLAEAKGFFWRRIDQARLTSNITYIITGK